MAEEIRSNPVAMVADAAGPCFTIVARQGVRQHQFGVVEGF